MALGISKHTRRKSNQFVEDSSERRLGVCGLFGIEASILVHSERNQTVNCPDVAKIGGLASNA